MLLLSSSALSEAARAGSHRASGNINVLGNTTHLSNAAAVPTTAEGQRQQCYKAKRRNGYTLSVGNRIYIQSEINNTTRARKGINKQLWLYH